MDQEIKKEARKQYFHYFRFWFIIVGVLAVIFVAVSAAQLLRGRHTRTNHAAPEERVYDYAGVLTDQEEEKLRRYIAEKEAEYQFDIVLLTLNEEMESKGDYDTVIMNRADDFYDDNQYGYDKIHGDGVLLLDNWYEDEYGSQKGSCLSTCGAVYERFGTYDINRVLDAVYYKVDEDPYAAYKAYIDTTCQLMERGNGRPVIPIAVVIILPLIVAGIYAASHLVQSPAKDTTTARTYVMGGGPAMKVQSDDFIRKNVTTVHISSSSGGGGPRSGGRGGSHRSSSGVRHGGGVRRR